MSESVEDFTFHEEGAHEIVVETQTKPIEKQSKEKADVSEKIQKWKEDQTKRLKEKDLAEEKAKENLKLVAKTELSEWKKIHDEVTLASKLLNIESAKNAEKENKVTLDLEETEDIWDRIAKLCDFTQSAKNMKSTKETTRMRLIILQLKQNPLEKV